MKRKKISPSTIIGILVGGFIGLEAGWLSATGTLNIPGIGSLASGGAWAAALIGLGIGLGAGALVGALSSGDDDTKPPS